MTAPSFILSGRTSDGDLHRLARPLPNSLAEAAPEQAERHEQLARRLGEATAIALACRQRLAEAQTADDEAAEKAIREGVGQRRCDSPTPTDGTGQRRCAKTQIWPSGSVAVNRRSPEAASSSSVMSAPAAPACSCSPSTSST